MNKINFKKWLPHIVAIALFAVIACIYCKPIFNGQVLQQHDVSQWKGMAKQSLDFQEKNGRFPLWTNSMFGGMPAYQIAYGSENPVTVGYIQKVMELFLPAPASYFFLACLCFYILALILGCNIYVAFFTALSYAYCTYNPVIIGAGHNTKMIAIAYMPAFIGGLTLIFQKKYIIGTALTALFTSFLIGANHAQITYYAIVIAIFMAISFGIHWIINKEYKHLIMAAALSIFGGALGVGVNLVSLATTNEYSKATIRGGSILADESGKGNSTKDGLKKDYALSYSMYKTEPLVMMVPRMYGGSNGLEMPEDKSKAIEALQQMPQQVAQSLNNYVSFYWGGIGGTSGPPYVGAIICLLAFIGFVVLDSKYKYWIAAASVFTIMLSWGSFFEGFNVWMLNHLPLYNKFRAPSMILVVPTLLLCIMAALSLNKMLFGEDKEALFAKYKKGLMVAGGFLALAFVIYLTSDYRSENDINLIKQIEEIKDANQKSVILDAAKSLQKGLVADRKSLFFNDILRTLAFMLIAAAALYFVIKNKLKWQFGLVIIGVFAFIDVMLVNVNYLSSTNYQDAEEYQSTFNPSPADIEIQKDKSHYRVFDLTSGVNTAFNGGALTAYFHNSLGGYHAAKLSLYQDLIERQFYNFPNCFPAVNMMNVKYIIQRDNQTGQPFAQQNPEALGNCWFVKNVQFKKTPLDVMNALTGFSPKDTALVEEASKSLVKYDEIADTTAAISLVKNNNDYVEYTSSSASNKFAVFSEVFYDKGWVATIDGKETPIVKTNYVLRGLSVPAGNHKIVFEFKPASYYNSQKFAIVASAIIWLLLIAAAWFGFKKKALV
ncbi:MAG: YfhO family protein [Chitinophagaceae bacterium]